MKTLYLFVIALFLTGPGFLQSQVNFEKRIEFDLKDDYFGERVFEFEEYGMVMRSWKQKPGSRMTEWKYELYDVGLRAVKSVSFDIETRLSGHFTRNTDTHTHHLLSRKERYMIVSTRVPTLEQNHIEFELPPKTRVRWFQVLGDYAYMFSVIKKIPNLFIVNWKTGELKIIPVRIEGVKAKKVGIEKLQILKESQEVFLFINAPAGKRAQDIHVIHFDKEGKKKRQFNLTGDIDKNLLDISASRISPEKLILSGTYSSSSSSTSQGLFFTEEEDGELNFFKTYKFSELENFREFMSKRQQKRLARKEKKAERKDKEFDINYRIAGHNVKPTEDGFIFLGEAFYPTYYTRSSTTTTMVNGSPVTRTTYQTVFDGYQYTHAVLAKFSADGELIWDECFNMWMAYKPFYVKNFIRTEEKLDNTIELVFASRSSIISKTYDSDGNVEKEFESESIEPLQDGDKVKRSYSNLQYWYGNYFLAYGTQKIKNKGKSGGGKVKRKVFFVSKISY
ncbi:MAG: hypothetical protein AB8F95_20500 [Bacteroidia bacterium]